MTAINVFLRRDRAIMMTDASLYTPQGVVVGFGQKAVAIPSLRAVLACRGNQKVTALLAMELAAAYSSFDEMAENAAGHLRHYHDLHLMELAQLGLQDINIVVAGWSGGADAPAGFYYDSTSDAFDMIDGYAAGPLPDEDEDANLHAIGCEIDVDVSPAAFDPVRHGIPFMEAQRRMQIEISDVAEPMSIVGGHILLSEVTREGVSQRIIHRWDDEIGEPIVPAPFVAPATSTMTRQQRRAMERQQRKANFH